MSSPDRSLRLPPGALIFRQGDEGEEMFVISKGRVSLRLGAEGQEREIAVLGPGEFFGELSLLGRQPRTATAVTTDETEVLPVRRDTFGLMMQDDLEVVFRMMDALGRRLGDTDRHVEALAARLRRVQAIAAVLRRCLAAGQGSLSVEAAAVAQETDMPVADAEKLIAALAGRGIGRLEQGRWSLDTTADARRLADALVAE